jgi:serine/threonine protein kinase/WD40 repeat protein
MNSTREELLFALVLTKPARERAVWLDRECADDPALRARLEALLVAHEQPHTSLTLEARGFSDTNGDQQPPVERQGAAARSDAENIPTLKLDLEDSPQDEAVGQTLGRYKLLENIGEGGCGVVYVAEQTEPVRRRVALKVIKLGMDTKAVVARFEAERQALAMMDHPNIAKVLDAGTTENGRPFFVMELVRGIKITDYCDQNNLPTKDRLDLFIKVCQAIQHAHQKGIIHRDIKPSNILVTLHDGVPVPKVIDFGIAKATEGRLTDATVYTQLHQFIGTPAYMSPEQAEMSGLDVDTRSDIYSLGVLLYELLTGRTPFDAKELMSLGIDEMRKTIREKEPVRPSTKLATLQGDELTTTAKRRSADAPKLINLLRGDLDWIVMKCLEKDRTRRYETANGLAADLKRHLSHEPVVARPPSRAYRFQKAFRRNRLAFTAGVAVAAALVAGIGISTWQMIRATRAERQQHQLREVAVKALNGEKEQRAQAERERERADAQAQKASESQEQSRRLLYASDMNLAQQALRHNNVGKARRLLDRHRPKPGEEDLRGWEWRYLWQLTRSGALVTLTNRPVRGFSVSFSDDGSRLAVGWFDGHVDLWDVSSRRMIRSLTDREYPHAGRVAFSHRGHLLAATAEPKTIALYDLDTGRESVVWKAPSQGLWDVRDVSFSADDSKVAIYTAENGPQPVDLRDEISVVDAATRKVEFRYPALNAGDNHFGAARLSPDNRRLYAARSDYDHYRYSIDCIDLATGQSLWQTDLQRDQGLTSLALSPNGNVLASASGYEDPSIRIWDTSNGKLLFRLDGHTSWVGKLAFSEDGKRLISAAADQSIRIWDTSNWTELRVLRGHADEVHAVAVSDAAQLIASASKDGDLMLWKEEGQAVADGYRQMAVDVSRNQVGMLDQARVLLAPRGRPPEIVDLKGDSSPLILTEIGFGTNLFPTFGTNVICYWDGTNQILVSELRGDHLIPHGAIKLNPGTRPLACGYHEQRQLVAWTEVAAPMSVYFARLTALGRRVELKSDIAPVRFLFFNDDATYLIGAVGETGFLRVWNIETGQIVVSLKERARDFVFAAGGRVLAVSVAQWNNHEMRFYDLEHPERSPRCFPGKHFGSSVAISPQGLVASATGGGEVRLFDGAKGELIEAVHGHLNAIFGLAFSPDGRRLISSSGGREAVKLWDVGIRQELLTLSGTGSTIGVADWTRDGDVILAGPPWQAWRAPSWEEIAASEAKEKMEIKP